MIQHEITIHLNRPVEQVFAFLADTGKVSTWQSSLIKTEPLTEGPLRSGSRFREVRRLGKKSPKFKEKLRYLNLISASKQRPLPSLMSRSAIPSSPRMAALDSNTGLSCLPPA